jgi:cytochrome b561
MKNKTYSPIYRVTHWLIAISLILTLATIFLRLTWLNKNNIANIIGDYLDTTDQQLDQNQLIQLAKKIRKPMWQWHIYLGYFLVGLFAIRFMLPFFGEMKFKNPLKRGLSVKEKFQYWVYIVFYFCIVVSLVTGLFIEFGDKSLKEPMEDIHVLSIYYLIGYIIIHIGGVIFAEFTSDKGIVSRIISGKKKEINR